MTARLARHTLLALSAWVLLASSAVAGQTVRVETRAGKVVTGQIDARTDDTQLWLRFTGTTTIVLRPIAWRFVSVVRPVTDDRAEDAAASAVPASDSNAGQALQALGFERADLATDSR